MDSRRLTLVAVPLLILLGTALYLIRRNRPAREKVAVVNNKRLRLVSDSVTKLGCDVLVLENDSQLSFQPDIAQEAAKVGGESILRECSAWIAKYGPLLPGENAYTEGGSLPVKHIMHVVATPDPDLDFLHDLFLEELREAAQKYQSQSIAFTLVGLNSGYSREDYCSLLLKQCKLLLNSQEMEQVHEVVLVARDQRSFDLLAQGLS